MGQVLAQIHDERASRTSAIFCHLPEGYTGPAKVVSGGELVCAVEDAQIAVEIAVAATSSAGGYSVVEVRPAVLGDLVPPHTSVEDWRRWPRPVESG